MEFIKHIYHSFSRTAVRMDFSDCAILVVGVVLVGFLCMRGFGSRTNW